MAHLWNGSEVTLQEPPCLVLSDHRAEGPTTPVFVHGKRENTRARLRTNVCLALAFVSFQGLGVVLLMEKAGMARCLPGTPRPFRKPCCQLSSALPASRGVCSPFLEKLHLETEFACSKPSYFLLFQVGTTNPIARQFLLHQTLQ